MFCAVLLECVFGGNCFHRLIVDLEVDKVQAAVVVNKDSGAFVVLLGKFTFQLHIKSKFS